MEGDSRVAAPLAEKSGTAPARPGVRSDAPVIGRSIARMPTSRSRSSEAAGDREPPADTFGPFAARARSEAGWFYHEIDASHSPNVTAPELLTALLQKIVTT